MGELRKYETLFVIHPDRVEEKDSVLEKITEIITKDQGQVLKVDEWGMRKFAYPIEKKKHGYYILMEFASPAETPDRLTQNFRLDERIIRFIVVKLDEKFEPQANVA